MLEGFPAPWGLCSSPPRDVWAPQARECSRCISGRNQGTAWQRLGLLLSFAPYCQTLGFLFLQAGSALAWPRHPWHAEKEPCMSEIHSSSHQQSIPWELGGTSRAKPVPHPTSDQLLSPTLLCSYPMLSPWNHRHPLWLHLPGLPVQSPHTASITLLFIPFPVLFFLSTSQSASSHNPPPLLASPPLLRSLFPILT